MTQIICSAAVLLSVALLGTACASPKPAIGARERDEINQRADETARQAQEEKERKKRGGN